MDTHHYDLLKLMLDNRLTGTERALSRKNVLFVVSKLSAVAELRQFAARYVDMANVTFATVEDVCFVTERPLYDAILTVFGVEDNVSSDQILLIRLMILLVDGGTLIMKTPVGTVDTLVKLMKLYGFLNVGLSKSVPGVVFGNIPTYKVGSSDKITLKLKAKENIISAWKLDGDNSETISEDDLLEADDLKKPDSSSLRVCATTKKAKACKDCSCGLAEELEANRLKDTRKPDTSNAKSSCGSCYLGDAFRCASCPYLGMPAFKPGEKVQLAGNLLQDDF